MRAIFLLLAVVLSSCGPKHCDFFTHYDDGTVKPRVALVPSIDVCSDEKGTIRFIDTNIRYNLMDCGNLFVYSEDDLQDCLFRAGDMTDWRDLNYTRFFKPADFVVQTELIQNELLHYAESSCSGRVDALYMKMRLKVIDIRENDPRVICSEIVCEIYPMSRKGRCDTSPVLAYQKFGKKIANRLEEVIWGCN